MVCHFLVQSFEIAVVLLFQERVLKVYRQTATATATTVESEQRFKAKDVICRGQEKVTMTKDAPLGDDGSQGR